MALDHLVRACSAQQGTHPGEEGGAAEGKLAWEDPVTKERHFTTPLCLESGRKRAADFPPSTFRPEPPTKYTQKGGGKGSGKGKKGKGQKKKSGSLATPGCASTSPDGRSICYQFNNTNSRCNNAKCKFAHVCGVCFAKDSPMYVCTHTGGWPAAK